MSSQYHLICINHDPAVLLGDNGCINSVDGIVEFMKDIRAGELDYDYNNTGHEKCLLWIGRYSYPLVEVGCPGGPGPDFSHQHRNIEWMDADYLRVLLVGLRALTPQAHRGLRTEHQCFNLARLERIEHMLTADMNYDGGLKPTTPSQDGPSAMLKPGTTGGGGSSNPSRTHVAGIEHHRPHTTKDRHRGKVGYGHRGVGNIGSRNCFLYHRVALVGTQQNCGGEVRRDVGRIQEAGRRSLRKDIGIQKHLHPAPLPFHWSDRLGCWEIRGLKNHNDVSAVTCHTYPRRPHSVAGWKNTMSGGN